LWFCGRSEIESKSSRFRCLSPRRLVASNLGRYKASYSLFYSKLSLCSSTYCHEDRANLVPISDRYLSQINQGKYFHPSTISVRCFSPCLCSQGKYYDTSKNGVTSITTIQLLIVLRQKLYTNDIVSIITAVSLITLVTF
jgi:hypothetical protein